MEKLKELVSILEEEVEIFAKIAETRDTPSTFAQPLADLAKRKAEVKAEIAKQ